LADAHIICTDKDQASEEVGKALDLIEHVSTIFGLTKGEDYWYRLSLGDRADDKKYYKNDAAWDESEEVLRNLLIRRGAKFFEAEQEAAFYGPKIDVQMKDVRGKENTAFTVQYDFCMPDRFNLTYTAADGTEKKSIVVHRSSIGAIERVMAFLIEKYAGAFPTWLAPVQVKVIPISDSHATYANDVVMQMMSAGIRAELDASNDSLGKRLRNAKLQKTPYIAVIGDTEIKDNSLSVEARNGKWEVSPGTRDFIRHMEREIKKRVLASAAQLVIED
jgi:threonyl-tRNA synthetase